MRVALLWGLGRNQADRANVRYATTVKRDPLQVAVGYDHRTSCSRFRHYTDPVTRHTSLPLTLIDPCSAYSVVPLNAAHDILYSPECALRFHLACMTRARTFAAPTFYIDDGSAISRVLRPHRLCAMQTLDVDRTPLLQILVVPGHGVVILIS